MKQKHKLLWESDTTVETVCLLSKLKSGKYIEVELEMDELDLTAAERAKVTYQEIKDALRHSEMIL